MNVLVLVIYGENVCIVESYVYAFISMILCI